MDQQNQPIVTESALPNQTLTESAASTEPRNRLAMILLAFFAMPTGLARIYQGDSSGWGRFWAWVVATVLSVVPLINLLALLVLLVLSIWGLVDFFMLYASKADANGTPYQTSKRDDHAAKLVRTALFVMIGLWAVVILLMVLAVVFFVINGSGLSTPFPSPAMFDYTNSY